MPRNPFWRKNATLITTSQDAIKSLGAHTNIIVTRSGRAGNATRKEAGHVSIVMLSPTTPGFMYTTELVLLGERCNIDIKENIQDRALGESIYRAWDLGQGSAGEDLLAKAKNEAKNIQSRFNNNRPLYSKNWSNTWTNTWNCASYAERIVRATGLNVSAGFFITSPLELTTGHSIVSRMVINKTKSGNQAWYVKG